MINTDTPQFSRNPCAQIKTWERVALTLATLCSIALIAIGYFWQGAPASPALYYTMGGTGLWLTLLAFGVLAKKRQPQLQQRTTENVQSEQVAQAEDLAQLLSQALTYINSLNLPEPLAETMAQGYAARQVYSKEELRGDFQEVASYELSVAVPHMRKMLDALPYHLGLKAQECPSLFPAVGIPNFGNSCFLNVSLQALVHTRYADYALLRPIRPLVQVNNPGPQQAIEAIDEELAQKQADWLRTEQERRPEHLAKNQERKKTLLHLIEKMRLGQSPTQQEIEKLYALFPLLQQGEAGDSSTCLGYLDKFSPSDYNVVICTDADSRPTIEKYVTSHNLPVVIHRSPGHVSAVVRNVWINDSSCSTTVPTGLERLPVMSRREMREHQIENKNGGGAPQTKGFIPDSEIDNWEWSELIYL